MKTVKNKKYTQKDLVKQIRKVSEQMRDLGVNMDYYGGFGVIAQHGREMVGAANIAEGWAKELESENT